MFKRALSFLGIFFGMAMMASVGDVIPQRLGSINRNTTMYSASQVDELIGTGPSGDPSGSVKTNSSGVIEANIGVNGDFTQSNGVVRLNTTDGTDGVYIGEESLSDIFSGYLPTHYGDASIEYGPVAAGIDGIVVSSLYSDFLGYGELFWMGGDATRNSSIGPLGSIVDYYSSISARQEMENYVTNVTSNMKVGEINNGTNIIDAAGNVYVINQKWKYFCNGVTYTESEWTAINEEQYGTSGKVLWLENGQFEWGADWFDFTGWYMEDGSGTLPVGITGNPPNYSIPAYASDTNALMLVYNWYGQSVVAFRKEPIGKVALTKDVPIVDFPTTNAVSGTAADAKATGTALYTGFTQWEVIGLQSGVYVTNAVFQEENDSMYWSITLSNGEWADYSGESDSTVLPGNQTITCSSGFPYGATATRHIVTPTKTSQLRNDGTNGVPFAQISDLNYEIVFSGGWLVSGSDVQPWHLYSVEQIDNEVYWTYILRDNGIEISRADIGMRDSSVDFSISGDPPVNISAIYRGYDLLSRKVNIINVSANATVAFPSNSAGESTDFYINMMVSDLQPQSVSFVDSNGNPISWVEPPPSTFSYGTNVIHVTEVDENVYSYTMPGAGSELRDVRIIGTLSQGHESASATNLYSTAQGTNTLASGIASHAEGGRTTSKGMYSHAEGVGTSANGLASHSQGLFTIAAERGSFAAGANAVASNSWSFAWSGIEGTPNYGSHGVSTFNVNPANGIYGFYIGNQTLEETIADAILAPANITNLIVAYETAQSSNDEATMPVTNGVAKSYTTLRSAVATVVGETINSPMDQLGGFSLPEYVSTLKKYEYDEVKGSYRKSISNDFIVLTFVTNIDVTAVQNISVLKAIEDRFKAAQQNP